MNFTMNGRPKWVLTRNEKVRLSEFACVFKAVYLLTNKILSSNYTHSSIQSIEILVIKPSIFATISLYGFYASRKVVSGIVVVFTQVYIHVYVVPMV